MKTHHHSSNSLVSSTFAELILFLLFIFLIYLSQIVTEKAADQTIIVLSEADGFTFQSGRSDLDGDFCRLLREEIAPQILRTAELYQWTAVEVKVIGHTDLVPIGNRRPYLDKINSWENSREGRQFKYGACASIDRDVKATNNLGLGFLRAVRVTGVLEASLSNERFSFLALSAGQFYPPESLGMLGRADSRRRRIEISISPK